MPADQLRLQARWTNKILEIIIHPEIDTEPAPVLDEAILIELPDLGIGELVDADAVLDHGAHGIGRHGNVEHDGAGRSSR